QRIGETRRPVIRAITKLELTPKRLQGLEREVGIQRLLNGKPGFLTLHSYLVYTKGQKKKVSLVMDAGDGIATDLVRNAAFTTQNKVEVSTGILVGLAQMHELGLIHADFKLDNCVFNRPVPRTPAQGFVIDFGFTFNAEDVD